MAEAIDRSRNTGLARTRPANANSPIPACSVTSVHPSRETPRCADKPAGPPHRGVTRSRRPNHDTERQPQRSRTHQYSDRGSRLRRKRPQGRDSSAAGGSHDASPRPQPHRRHQGIIDSGGKSPNSPSERPAASGRFLDQPKGISRSTGSRPCCPRRQPRRPRPGARCSGRRGTARRDRSGAPVSMSDHAEDPLAAAGAKVAGYASVAAVVAEAAAQMAAARARNRAATDEQRAAALRAQHQADYARARVGWAPFLDPELREQAGVRDAGLAWARAQQWRPDPEAERVSELAEDRLRTLRPDVMAVSYTHLR